MIDNAGLVVFELQDWALPISYRWFEDVLIHLYYYKP